MSFDLCFWDELPPDIGTAIGEPEDSSSARVPALGRLPSALVSIFGRRGEISGSMGVFGSAFFDFDEEKKLAAKVLGGFRVVPSEGPMVGDNYIDPDQD